MVWPGVLLVAFVLYAAQFAVLLVMEHRRQAHLAAWVLVMLLLPYIGLMIYWMAGRSPKRLQHCGLKHANEIEPSDPMEDDPIGSTHPGFDEASTIGLKEQFPRLFDLIAKNPDFSFTEGNQIRVLTDGDETYETMLKEMSKAKHHIHLDYYTIRGDGTGQLFAELLTDKARRGIEVKIIYDGIGTLKLDAAFLQKLHAAGCRTACFSPPVHSLLNRRLNFRNHRKILVIDGVTGFLGGINIGDEYVGLDPKLGFWRDTHLMLKGDSVRGLQNLFMEDWRLAAGETLNLQSIEYFPGHSSVGDERVLIVPGTPGVQEREIVEVLHAALSAAQKNIYATTPYFIPDPVIAASLAMAARSGLDVKLIVPGVSDSSLVLLATMSHVQEMLDAGVQIYRYRKGFIHAKVLLVDDNLASVGSANLDRRSLYSNYELLAIVFGPKPIQKLKRDFEEDLKNSEMMDAKTFADRSWRQKAAEAVMHILSPLL